MPETEPLEAKAPRDEVRITPQKVPHRRNQLLAFALVGVATSLFVIVLGLVIMLHYAETHHMLATL